MTKKEIRRVAKAFADQVMSEPRDHDDEEDFAGTSNETKETKNENETNETDGAVVADRAERADQNEQTCAEGGGERLVARSTTGSIGFDCTTNETTRTPKREN